MTTEQLIKLAICAFMLVFPAWRLIDVIRDNKRDKSQVNNLNSNNND